MQLNFEMEAIFLGQPYSNALDALRSVLSQPMTNAVGTMAVLGLSARMCANIICIFIFIGVHFLIEIKIPCNAATFTMKSVTFFGQFDCFHPVKRFSLMFEHH